jgi:hypothetical protein
MDLDLSKPIFVIYVNTENMTSKRTQETLNNAKDLFSVYSNITTWVISSNKNKIECIWNGKTNKKAGIKSLIKEINKKIDLINTSPEELVLNIRDIKIDQIINE